MLTPLFSREQKRLQALKRMDVLDTSTEASFDRIVNLAARVFGVPMVAISFVDRYRQWLKTAQGLELCSSPRHLSFCAHAIQKNGVFVVSDAWADTRFCNNTLVTSDPYVRFYAGAPLWSREGEALGALCLLDRAPRELSADECQTLQDLSALVVDALELRLAMQPWA